VAPNRPDLAIQAFFFGFQLTKCRAQRGRDIHRQVSPTQEARVGLTMHIRPIEEEFTKRSLNKGHTAHRPLARNFRLFIG
jgi:hypothetical protein